MRRAQKLLALAACGALASCALLDKGDPVVPRYFTPMDDGAASPPVVKAQAPLELKLGVIEGWAHLREPMAVRISPQEIVYSDGQRWTERPAVYLQRELSLALFDERGMTEVMSGRAPTLDVELSAFEELKQPQDRVRLRASYVLHDDRLALLQDTVTVEEPVPEVKAGERPDAVVAAFAKVLRRGVEQIAEQVAARLSASVASTAAH